VLARLDNIDLQLAVLNLEGEEARLQQQLENLLHLRHVDERVHLQLPATQEMLATVEKQLQEKREELGRLTIVAPRSGLVVPPPHRPRRDPGDGRLPGWSGSPFDRENQGAIMMSSDQFCQIGDPQLFEAVLVIDQADIELVTRSYQQHDSQWPKVDLKLDAYRWQTIHGQIDKVASAPMEVSPTSLSAQGGGELDTVTDRQTGLLRPISTSYQARVPLEQTDVQLRVGLTGNAKVYTGWQPLGERLARYLFRTFHFDW
jgi:putative peptide zinc metalloprotease protein